MATRDWLLTALVYLMLENQMSESISQDICDTARLPEECVCSCEAWWTTRHKMHIKVAAYELNI